MAQVTETRYRPDDVITALLAYLPKEFNNDAEKIHSIFYELKRDGKYNDLIGSLEFVQYERFPYSPLLGRILNRLQESRLLSSMNPEYLKYQIKDESRKAIESYYLEAGKPLYSQREKLEEIATRLKKDL